MTIQRRVPTDLPKMVLELPPREREVATVVYTKGQATANQVVARLSQPISNGAVRSMLNRLVGKQILKRDRKVRYGAFTYRPAQKTPVLVEQAFRQVATDYFSGSLHRTAVAIVDLVMKEEQLRSQ